MYAAEQFISGVSIKEARHASDYQITRAYKGLAAQEVGVRLAL